MNYSAVIVVVIIIISGISVVVGAKRIRFLIYLLRILGKFTKTGKFRLHVTSLNVIAPHARYKVRRSYLWRRVQV